MPRGGDYLGGLSLPPDSIPMEAIDGLLDKSPGAPGARQLNPDVLPAVWFVEYSANGADPNGWHDTFVSGQDFYMRQRTGTNPWSDPIRIVGEQGAGGGHWFDFRFKRHPDAPTGSELPNGDIPAGWSDAPPTGTDPLWMVKAEKDEAGSLVSAWSTPTRLSGEDGADAPLLSVRYSANGVDWYTSWATGRVYMVTSADGGVTWSDPVRIVGEQGDQGTQGNFADYWFAASLNSPAKPGDNVATPSAPWQGSPPSIPTGQFLWMTRAYKKFDGTCRDATGTWSQPVRLSGEKGATGTFDDHSWTPDAVQAHLAALIANGGISLGGVGDTYVLRGKLAAENLEAGTITALITIISPTIEGGTFTTDSDVNNPRAVLGGEGLMFYQGAGGGDPAQEGWTGFYVGPHPTWGAGLIIDSNWLPIIFSTAGGAPIVFDMNGEGAMFHAFPQWGFLSGKETFTNVPAKGIQTRTIDIGTSGRLSGATDVTAVATVCNTTRPDLFVASTGAVNPNSFSLSVYNGHSIATTLMVSWMVMALG